MPIWVSSIRSGERFLGHRFSCDNAEQTQMVTKTSAEIEDYAVISVIFCDLVKMIGFKELFLADPI